MPSATIGSRAYNAAQKEAAKQVTAKAAAAAIVITLATDVSNSSWAAAAKKAHDLGRRYEELAAARLP